ncbi:hypothetical protein AMS68_000393 [Peltaster fructicola]|uniref:Putative 5'-nucleotidase C-terminal domain-containing protein n=1 Tax=Peltaster fructicola TaxID=286661 RepID=A0A6H0XJI6_9PEZI|nr:hypothetical protein AMS68_000393 [Peltaster fructicola]
MHWTTLLSLLASSALACDTCAEPARDAVHVRNVRRMQPDAQNASYGPKEALKWGQLNFLHTTDTHGWLEGHLKEKNYGADWGDFASFVKRMRQQADDYGVDLLVVDTGDLHDGAGLSDATTPNGVVSNALFEEIDYDLLSIGNHELYVSSIAYEHFYNFSRVFGERYLTSNVQIFSPVTNKFEYIGQKYRYFTTKNNGFNIVALGVLYDFKGNSNVSKVETAANMVKEQWFIDLLNDERPVDAYVLIGHNPVSPKDSTSTFPIIFNAIRAVHPDIPIQIFGGHSHIRDLAVYDNKAIALESGRYCETLGFLSMSGFNTCDDPEDEDDDSCVDSYPPCEIPQPEQPAVQVGTKNYTGTVALKKSTSDSDFLYFRSYLDWNRLTFEYHAKGSQSRFDTSKGLSITKNITAERNDLKLSTLLGCAPQTWCISCQPFGNSGNIFTVLSQALAATVINQTRSANARIILLNTGSVRFDLPKGPFTFDDSFIVSPFSDAFEYLPNIPYSVASQVLAQLNAGQASKRDLDQRDFSFYNPGLNTAEDCVDPEIKYDGLKKRSIGKNIRRQAIVNTPGYTTTDAFGTDGDDTVHSSIPSYSIPNYFGANANFPASGNPDTVDLIFLDYIVPDTITALGNLGYKADKSQVTYYLPQNYTTNSYLPAYAKIAADWQKDVPNCPTQLNLPSSTAYDSINSASFYIFRIFEEPSRPSHLSCIERLASCWRESKHHNSLLGGTHTHNGSSYTCSSSSSKHTDVTPARRARQTPTTPLRRLARKTAGPQRDNVPRLDIWSDWHRWVTAMQHELTASGHWSLIDGTEEILERPENVAQSPYSPSQDTVYDIQLEQFHAQQLRMSQIMDTVEHTTTQRFRTQLQTDAVAADRKPWEAARLLCQVTSENEQRYLQDTVTNSRYRGSVLELYLGVRDRQKPSKLHEMGIDDRTLMEQLVQELKPTFPDFFAAFSTEQQMYEKGPEWLAMKLIEHEHDKNKDA